MDIGEKLRNARKLAKLTQEQLAQKSGVAAVTIRQYESGKHQPRLEQLSALSHALEISLLYFVNDSSVARTFEEARQLHRDYEREMEIDHCVEKLLEAMYGKRTEKVIGDRRIMTETISIYGTGKDAVSVPSFLFMAISEAIQGVVEPMLRHLTQTFEEDEEEFWRTVPKAEKYLQETSKSSAHDEDDEEDSCDDSSNPTALSDLENQEEPEE